MSHRRGKREQGLPAACQVGDPYGRTYLGRGAKTVVFPSISTGAYGFPLERATEIAMRETKKFLEKDEGLEGVVFVCFGERVLKTYQDVFARIF